MTRSGKKRWFPAALALLGWLLAAFSAPAAIPGLPVGGAPQAPGGGPAVAAEQAFYRLPGVEKNARILLAVLLTPKAADAYFYAHSSGDAGLPVTLALMSGADPGASLSARVLYPGGEPKQDPYSGRVVPAHAGPARFYLEIPPEAQNGPARLAVSLLLCTPRNCTPVKFSVPLAVPAPDALPPADAQPWWPEYRGLAQAQSPGAASGASPTAPAAASAPFPEDIRPVFFAPALEVASLGKALLLGFFAGLLLNVMPCVLPVLGIKLTALLHGGDTPAVRRRFVRHQVFFAAGIMAWFTAMAGIFAGLGLAWGQIFQSPGVALGLALLLFLLALNLFGVLSLPVLDVRAGESRHPDARAFGGGLTATLLATPCSGPLLGGVLGWALMQPPAILMLSLESVGLGMAFPYLLLACRPSLASRLPRPGPWMLAMEHLLAFLLLGTVVYLLILLPLSLLPKALVSLLLTAVAAWLWGQIGGPSAGPKRRFAARLAAAGLALFACFWPLRPDSADFAWQVYSEEQFRADFGNQAMLVDFTADWCPTCKVMEAATLTPERMADWQARYSLRAVRVDLTRDNPAGLTLLRRLGSASIPLVAIFPAGEKAKTPLVLRDVVTPGQMGEALENALGTAGAKP